MARTYAKVRIAIWADDDFRQLTDPAQALYFRLLTSPTLSLAGVADWRPVRLAHLTRGMTAQQLNNAASELAEALYVVVDEDTEEILLRSFIRHDGIMKYPNIATSMLKDYAAIFSPTLKGVVVHELRRLHDEEPDMAGWKVIGERLDDKAIDPTELTPFNGSNLVPKQFDIGSTNGYPNGSGNGSYIPQPSTLNQQPTTLIPSESPDGDPRTPKRHAYSDVFETFWDAFPSDRKGAKKQCAQKFATAVQEGVDPEEIILAAERYRDDPNREPQFTVSPHRWLNEGRWESGPLPARTPTQGTHSDRFTDWDRAAAQVNAIQNNNQLRAIEGGNPWP